MIKPKKAWKPVYRAIPSDDNQNHEHNGKAFTVLKDITEPYFKTAEGEREYGYVRVYQIQLEDGSIIDALEEEVEEF